MLGFEPRASHMLYMVYHRAIHTTPFYLKFISPSHCISRFKLKSACPQPLFNATSLPQASWNPIHRVLLWSALERQGECRTMTHLPTLPVTCLSSGSTFGSFESHHSHTSISSDWEASPFYPFTSQVSWEVFQSYLVSHFFRKVFLHLPSTRLCRVPVHKLL